MKKNKWILFDFGGCLDSDGIHSRDLFMRHFFKYIPKISNQHAIQFNDAYTFTDTLLTCNQMLLNSNLLEMNTLMCTYLKNYLCISLRENPSQIAQNITQEQSYYLTRNKLILRKLKDQFNIGIVSNFSGNLSIILEEFKLTPYLDFALDSYHVGVSKPDIAIFNMALEKSDAIASDIIFVGDNIFRDIIPAKKLGMTTILISKKKSQTISDFSIRSLDKILELTQIK